MQAPQQGQAWKRIADVYQLRDRDRFEPVALEELSDLLPEMDPQEIARILTEAREQGRASSTGDGRFRLVPNH